jgi:hypothetical protein
MGPLGPESGATEEEGRNDGAEGGAPSGKFAAGAVRPQPPLRTTTAKARCGTRSMRDSVTLLRAREHLRCDSVLGDDAGGHEHADGQFVRVPNRLRIRGALIRFIWAQGRRSARLLARLPPKWVSTCRAHGCSFVVSVEAFKEATIAGFITERDLEKAEDAFPGIREFFESLSRKPLTFLELVSKFEDWHGPAHDVREAA